MIIKGDTPEQGNTLTYGDDGYLHWTTHDNVLELYENDSFRMTIYFDTAIVPGVFVGYSKDRIFTLSLATHHKIFCEIIRINSLQEDYEAVLRGILSASRSSPAETFTYSGFISETSDSGKVLAITSSNTLFTANARLNCVANALYLEKSPINFAAECSGNEGTIGFFKGLLWGKSSEVSVNKTLGICPLSVTPKGVLVASFDDSLVLKVWSTNAKMPVASFYLDGSAKRTDNEYCNVQLHGFTKSFESDANNDNNDSKSMRLTISCTLTSVSDSTTCLKVFTPVVTSRHQFGMFEIHNPFTHVEFLCDPINDDMTTISSCDDDADSKGIPKQIIAECLPEKEKDDIILYIYYYQFNKHNFKSIKINECADATSCVVDDDMDEGYKPNIVVDGKMSLICGITLHNELKEIMCTSKRSVGIIRKTTLQKRYLRSVQGIQDLKLDIDELFEIGNHKMDNKIIIEKVKEVKVSVEEQIADVKSELNDLNEKMTFDRDVGVDVNAKYNNSGYYITFMKSVLVQYYESLFQFYKDLLIRINAFDDGNSDSENEMVISMMRRLKLYVYLLSITNNQSK